MALHREILRAERLLEGGELETAKNVLLRALEKDPTPKELDRILLATNTLVALEIISVALRTNSRIVLRGTASLKKRLEAALQRGITEIEKELGGKLEDF